MNTGKFIVGSLDNRDGLSLSAAPKEHPSESVARKEAERLAKCYRPKQFVVLQIVGKVAVSDVVWS